MVDRMQLDGTSFLSRYFPFILLGLAIITRLQTFFIPIYNGDESNYAIHALELLRGGLPYADVAMKKPPFIFYYYAAAMAIIPDLRWVHAVTVVIIAFSGYALYRSILVWIPQPSKEVQQAAMMAGIGYVLFSMNYIEMDVWATHVEVIGNCFLCVALWMWILANKNKSYLIYFVLGCLVGLASICRHPHGAILLAFLGAMIIRWREGKAIQSIVSMGIGFTLIWGGIFLWAWFQGIYQPFMEYVVYENFRYISPTNSLQLQWYDYFFRFGGYLVACLPLVYLSVYGWIHGEKRANPNSEGSTRDNQTANPTFSTIRIFIILWFSLGVGTILLGNRLYGHYYLIWLPLLSWAAAIGWMTLQNGRLRKIIRIAILGITLGFQILGGYRTFTGSFEAENPAIKEIINTAGKYTKPGDYAFIWGNFTHPYYHLRLKPSSRYITCEYLVDYRGQQLNPATRNHRYEQLLKDLESHPPQLIIDTSKSDLFPYWKGILPERIDFLNHWITSFYKKKEILHGVAFYVRTGFKGDR
jgi:hypothetical protein